MKQQRKEDLLYSFPPVPYQIEAQMKGRGAQNFCVFLTNGHELFVRCYHRYTNGDLAEQLTAQHISNAEVNLFENVLKTE